MIKKILPYCPECNILATNCDCSFNCPACGEEGQYDEKNNLLCPTADCRVRRFFSQ